MVPVIILGGIYGGFMTPTEAAAVAATLRPLVGVFVYKGITRHNIVKILVNCGITSAVVILLISMASIFGYIMAIERVPGCHRLHIALHHVRQVRDAASSQHLPSTGGGAH